MSCACDDNEYTWKLVAGDDSTRVFQYQDADGTPIDLTGYTAALTYDVGLIEGSIVGTVNGPAGTVTVSFPDTLTSTFLGNGSFRLRITSGGGLVTTLASGLLKVKR